jgi:peroxiredoxin
MWHLTQFNHATGTNVKSPYNARSRKNFSKMMKKQFITLLWIMSVSTLMHPLKAAETGTKIPNCQLSSLTTEKQYVLEQYKGKVVYLDFWASWCPSCAKSFSFLNELNRDLKARGLEVVVVNLDEEVADAHVFLSKHIADFTVVADTTKQCAKDFNVEGMPASYLIDRNGVIRHTHVGFRNEDTKELREIVEKLLLENLASN